MVNEVIITSALRTAVGSLGKSLRKIPAHLLGSSVISESVKSLSLELNDIDEVIMGQVLTAGSGQNPARQASMEVEFQKRFPLSLSIKSVVLGLDQWFQAYKV